MTLVLCLSFTVPTCARSEEIARPAQQFLVRVASVSALAEPKGRGPAAREARLQTASARPTLDWSGSLRITEGESGVMTVGRLEQVESVGLGWLWGAWLSRADYVDAASGLEVRAEGAPAGRVRLEIRPFVATLEDDDGLQYANTKSVVVLESGGEALLSSWSPLSPSSGARISAVSRRNSAPGTALWVSVERLGSDASDAAE